MVLVVTPSYLTTVWSYLIVRRQLRRLLLVQPQAVSPPCPLFAEVPKVLLPVPVQRLSSCSVISVTVVLMSAAKPHAAMARWENGRLEVVDSNQGSHAVAQLLAALFSLDMDSVRVRSEHVGGAFGSKGFNAHLILAVMATTQLDRPVRVVLTRRQMFSLVGYRPATAQRVRLGADADGRLRYRETIVNGLERAPEALARMLAGETIGKTLVRIA